MQFHCECRGIISHLIWIQTEETKGISDPLHPGMYIRRQDGISTALHHVLTYDSLTELLFDVTAYTARERLVDAVHESHHIGW